jgi:magnesium transporter
MKQKKIVYPKMNTFSSPGSLTYIGKENNQKVGIKVFEYQKDEITEKKFGENENLSIHRKENQCLWLDVEGIHNSKLIQKIGNLYNFHPLLIEDILNTTQKPKYEYYEESNQLFVILKMIHFDADELDIRTEQVALVLGKDYLISFQEKDDKDIFEPIQTRITRKESKTRANKSDYLLYSLIDLVVDNYYLIMENIASLLENIEEQILINPLPIHQQKLYALKREMAFLRRAILPLRDIIAALIREENTLLSKNVNIYFRDVQDHILQTLETLEAYRDVADNIMSNYHSTLSNKMNSVMKTLTVFTAIFMPLTFIVGIYGMNFENMPELKTENGYFITLFSMSVLSVSLWIYFKWKKYI